MGFPSQAIPLAVPNLNMALGNPDGATSDPQNFEHYLIQRDKLAASYNNTHRWPNWVAWILEKCDIGNVARDPNFEPDRDLPAGYVEVVTGDYDHAGYDRGHMEPSKDETDTEADNAELFRLSNCVPQLHALNAGPWEKLEAWCRSLAELEFDLFVICGPIAPGPGQPVKKIGRDQVTVPVACWKVVVIVPPGQGSPLDRVTIDCRVVGAIMPNDASVTLRDDWRRYQTSVGEIERQTGLRFFSSLRLPVAAALRLKGATSAG